MRIALVCFLFAGCAPALVKRPTPQQQSEPASSSRIAIDLAQVSERVSSREQQVGFDRLTIPEQYFHAIWTLEAEVNNGGFDQYFFNSAGDFARVAPGALRTIGAPHAASIVERASKPFGADGPPKERTQRQRGLATLPPEAKAIWSAADKEFLAYPDNIAALLQAFVTTNRSSFE